MLWCLVSISGESIGLVSVWVSCFVAALDFLVLKATNDELPRHCNGFRYRIFLMDI